MKKILLTLCIFQLSTTFNFPLGFVAWHSQGLSTCKAQSAMVQKAAKSVVSITTYKADGSILKTTHGVFFGAPDECISAFSPFVGASKATIMDAYGHQAQVEAIIGANELYDICRFKVSEKVNPIIAADKAAVGKVFAISYSVQRPAAKPLTIKSSETFLDKYNFYIFNEEINDDIEGCPIVNATGQIIGLAQRPNGSYSIQSTDARYYLDLVASGLSANDNVMKKTFIRAALPSDHEQARLMLMMFDNKSDSLQVINTVNDYNQQYPTEVDGYSALCRYQISHGNLQQASKAMERCIATTLDKDEAYYEYAKQIYGVATYLPDSLRGTWTLDLAEENIKKALAIDNSSVYRHLLGEITYAKGNYEEAFKIFDEVSKGDMATSEVFYEMAQCKSHLGASDADVLPFLNQAVEHCPKPLTNVSAPYFYARGICLDNMGEYKKAVMDYNEYDTLMYLRAPAEFYYTRSKCETKIRMYQQAINDLAHAAYLTPNDASYLIELAAMELRFGQYENVINTCELAKNITDKNPDIYIIEGVAYMKQEKNEEARASFQKAKELGDSRADEYLSKLK